MGAHKPSKKLPVVKVYWVDAHQNSSGWLSDDDFASWLEEPGVMLSVGIMISRTKKWVALAMSAGFDTVSDCLKIPTGMVRKVVRLGTVSAEDLEPLPERRRLTCHQFFAPISSQSKRPCQSMSTGKTSGRASRRSQ